MRKPRFLHVFFALIASAGAASCAAVLGFERLSTEDGVLLDAGLDAAEASVPVEAGPDACGDLGVPGKPDAGGGGDAALFAVNLLDFGVDDQTGDTTIPPGLNLDQACSLTLATSTCKPSVTTDQLFTSLGVRDFTPSGLDNASFGLLRYLYGISDLLKPETVNGNIAEGRYGAVLRVNEWNRQADDGEVQVELFPAIGRQPRNDEAAGFGASDRWVLDERFRVPGTSGASQLVSNSAWVVGNRLVARFARLTMPVLLGDDPKPFDVVMNDVVFTATLANDNGMTSLKAGMLAGRWKTSDFLGQVRTIYFGDNSGLVDVSLCEPEAQPRVMYNYVRDTICASRDLRADSQDRANLGCDAVSAALRFEAYPVTDLGAFEPGPDIDVAARCNMPDAIPLGDDCTPN